MQEQQAPVAHCGPLAELQSDGLRVVERQVEIRHVLGLGALDLLCRGRFLGDAVQRCEHRRRSVRQAPVFAHFRRCEQHARLAQLERERGSRSGEPGLD